MARRSNGGWCCRHLANLLTKAMPLYIVTASALQHEIAPRRSFEDRFGTAYPEAGCDGGSRVSGCHGSPVSFWNCGIVGGWNHDCPAAAKAQPIPDREPPGPMGRPESILGRPLEGAGERMATAHFLSPGRTEASVSASPAEDPNSACARRPRPSLNTNLDLSRNGIAARFDREIAKLHTTHLR